MRTVVALSLFLVACTSAMSTGSGQSVMLTAAPSGTRVMLTLMNHGDSPIGYNLCTSGLQRRDPNDWVDVRTDEVCTMELRTLQPGATATFEKTLPANLTPGTYRYETSVEQPGGGGHVVVATDSFKAG